MQLKGMFIEVSSIFHEYIIGWNCSLVLAFMANSCFNVLFWGYSYNFVFENETDDLWSFFSISKFAFGLWNNLLVLDNDCIFGNLNLVFYLV